MQNIYIIFLLCALVSFCWCHSAAGTHEEEQQSFFFFFFLKPFQQVNNVIDSVNVEKAAAFTNATAHLIQDSVLTCTNRARYVCFLVNGYCTVWILYCTVHVTVSSLPVTSGPKFDSNLALNESRNDGRPVLWLMSFYSLFTGLHFSFKISVVFFLFLYRIYRFYFQILFYCSRFPPQCHVQFPFKVCARTRCWSLIGSAPFYASLLSCFLCIVCQKYINTATFYTLSNLIQLSVRMETM